MRIPGVVDVYQVGDEWVARSWPKVQNQPNSAAQLLWRKKFKDAHAMIKTWRGMYLDAWRAIYRPPGKMWLDIAMTSIMKRPGDFRSDLSVGNVVFTLSYGTWPTPFGDSHYRLNANAAASVFLFDLGGFALRHGASWKDVLAWTDAGWICPKGKRPKKKWLLNYASKGVVAWKVDWPWDNAWQFTNFYCEDCPGGITLTWLAEWTAGDPPEKNWSLSTPPIYNVPQ